MAATQTDRFLACWRLQNCNSCVNSKHGCGWCPFSSTCVPVSNLLEPVSNHDVCPLWNERFELRTRALGCGCSTTTLLGIVVTVFATIVALAVLYAIIISLKRCNRNFGTGSWHGLEINVEDNVTLIEREWKRKPQWTGNMAAQFRRNPLGSKQSEQEHVTERTRLLRQHD